MRGLLLGLVLAACGCAPGPAGPAADLAPRRASSPRAKPSAAVALTLRRDASSAGRATVEVTVRRGVEAVALTVTGARGLRVVRPRSALALGPLRPGAPVRAAVDFVAPDGGLLVVTATAAGRRVVRSLTVGEPADSGPRGRSVTDSRGRRLRVFAAAP